MNHIDQEAELYALGMLDEAERQRIDDHVRTCDDCAGRLGRAESAMAALVETTLRAPARRPARWPLAVAAAFALAAAGLLQQNLALHGAADTDGAMIAAMVDSHFLHQQFVDSHGAPIGAKVVYERHGDWYEVLATGAPQWHVVLVRPGGEREPLTAGLAPRGNASVLFVQHAGAARSIELEDQAGTVVASAHPALEAEKE